MPHPVVTSATPPQRQPVSSLYLLKCLFAFLVVTCHTPMGIAKGWLHPLAMGAVCVFFLISGYFLYHPDPNKSYQRAMKSLRTVVPIFLIVSLFYWAWLLPNYGNALTSFSQLWTWLLTGNLTSGHTWYLMAMLQGLLLLAVIFRLRGERYIWLLTPLCIFGLLGSQYAFLLTDERTRYYYDVYTSISYSIPFMSIGYLIAKYEGKLQRYQHWGGLFACSVVVAYAERILLHQTGHDYATGALFGSYLTAVLIFIWALQHKNFGAGSWMETIGAKYSGNIYYFHIAVATLIVRLLSALGLGEVYAQLGSIFVFIGSLIVSSIIVRVQDKVGIHLLK